jgi:exosome complex RNA-binding protein Rrp42 (RNase PH superfamily)
MQKGGKGSMTLGELTQCLDMSRDKGKEIRKIVG